MPSVPQVLHASSSGSFAVLVTWEQPAVFYRKYVHNLSGTDEGIQNGMHLHDCGYFTLLQKMAVE